MGNARRDIFIDFLKGLCIISVVLTHSLPVEVQKSTAFALWGQMAVPLFLILQTYHVFNAALRRKRDGNPPAPLCGHYNFGKVWNRIMLPFLTVTLLTAAALTAAGRDIPTIISSCISSGGIGPGSYYVWIYLQFFLLIPLFIPLFLRFGSGYFTLSLFIILSQCLEWTCIFIEIPEPAYRLSCLRYIFLIYFGFLWTSNHICRTITVPQTIAALLSMVILTVIYYTDSSLHPFLHDSAWRTFHWVCYFYVAMLLPRIIWWIYLRIPANVKNLIVEAGRYSYEIFLWQMMVFVLFPRFILNTGHAVVDTTLFILLSTFLSILPVVAWKRMRPMLSSKWLNMTDKA